jgi:EF hand
MGRLLYVWLVGLHPRHFRERFAEEMIGIYDVHTGKWRRAALFIDLLVSLFRQWVLRPGYSEPALSMPLAAKSSDIPGFYTFNSLLPRRSALVNGAILSLFFLTALTFFIGRSGHIPRLLVGTRTPRPQVLEVDGPSDWRADPTTRIKLKSEGEDPLYPFANAYFRMIRVLDVLDVDHDWIISPWEITNGPASLRRLDRNHDGKLSPEECGFYLGANPKIKLDPERVQRERLRFMQLNPVLAALDSDHDGEISADEIKNSPAALRTLDQNRDGRLTPDELLPGPWVGFTVDEIIKHH